MPSAGRLDTDGQLVREESRRRVRLFAEHDSRVLVRLQPVAQTMYEMPSLVALRAEPHQVRIRQHTVQNHQPLDGPAESDWLTVAVVRLADPCVQGFVVHMEESRPPVGPNVAA